MATIVSEKFEDIDWERLAREDPVAFEEKRKLEIENVISRAPVRLQHRLRCLQWRIDMARSRSPNPLAACISLYSMMWDSVLNERGLLNALKLLTGPDAQLTEWKQMRKSAQILPFNSNIPMDH